MVDSVVEEEVKSGEVVQPLLLPLFLAGDLPPLSICVCSWLGLLESGHSWGGLEALDGDVATEARGGRALVRTRRGPRRGLVDMALVAGKQRTAVERAHGTKKARTMAEGGKSTTARAPRVRFVDGAQPRDRLACAPALPPSPMSTYGTTRHHHSPAAGATFSTKDRVADYHTTLFRRLTWEGTVPLEIRVDSKELPANSDRGLECYYVQAPRVTYLPLLMPEIKRFLMDVVFDETAAQELKDEEWWFEGEYGTSLKWCVARPCPLDPL